MALGARIRFYRDKLALTLEQLSDRAGVDVGTISALELRDSQRSKYAPAIAKALGLTLEQLLDEQKDWLAEAASAADDQSAADSSRRLKSVVLADVLRFASPEDRRKVLDDVRMVLLRGRARFRAEEFHQTLDAIDRLDQDKDAPQRR
jgi:transcriptional regulator with XRE-family HTH domain